MKLIVAILFCLIGTSAHAQQFELRGEFVDTYLADDGFLDTIPRGTRLNCEERLCSSLKSVRIYVFRNTETVKRLWSTDYYDVMFDEPEKILAAGPENHVVYYDETDQMLYRGRTAN